MKRSQESENTPSFDPEVCPATAEFRELHSLAHWLTTLRINDLQSLRDTTEYSELFQSLRNIYRYHQSLHDSTVPSTAPTTAPSTHVPVSISRAKPPPVIRAGVNDDAASFSLFLGHDFAEKITHYLDAQSLVALSRCCKYLNKIVHRSAAHQVNSREDGIARLRQLPNAIQLLRAQEHLLGIENGVRDAHVRVPALLLPRRINVTDCSDPEYNGVYFCTGNNANGFVFTKPRVPEQHVNLSSPELDIAVLQHEQAYETEDMAELPRQLLRCILAKRFSNENLLWYCSKEVVTESNGTRSISQVFEYWASLMVIGELF